MKILARSYKLSSGETSTIFIHSLQSFYFFLPSLPSPSCLSSGFFSAFSPCLASLDGDFFPFVCRVAFTPNPRREKAMIIMNIQDEINSTASLRVKRDSLLELTSKAREKEEVSLDLSPRFSLSSSSFSPPQTALRIFAPFRASKRTEQERAKKCFELFFHLFSDFGSDERLIKSNLLNFAYEMRHGLGEWSENSDPKAIERHFICLGIRLCVLKIKQILKVFPGPFHESTCLHRTAQASGMGRYQQFYYPFYLNTSSHPRPPARSLALSLCVV